MWNIAPGAVLLTSRNRLCDFFLLRSIPSNRSTVFEAVLARYFSQVMATRLCPVRTSLTFYSMKSQVVTFWKLTGACVSSKKKREELGVIRNFQNNFKSVFPTKKGGGGGLAKYELEKVWLAYQSMCIHCNARGRHESRRARLLREDRSTRAQNWASRRGAFTFRQEKIKRFASSGISGHSKSRRTHTKLNGRGGMSFGPLWRDRRAVRVFAFTSCVSKNYDSLQPPVRKVLAFMLCRLPDVRHSPSEPPAKRTYWRRSTWTRAVRPPPAAVCMTVMDGVPDKKLVVVDHQLRKSIAGVRGERAR